MSKERSGERDWRIAAMVAAALAVTPGARGQEGAGGQEPEQPPPPPPPRLFIDLGRNNWWFEGNDHRFRQYASPPDGFDLRRLLYNSGYSGRHSGFLDLNSPGGQDYLIEGGTTISFGRTKIEGSVSRARYFDPTPTAIPASKRTVQAVTGSQAILPNVSLSAGYTMTQEDEDFEAPTDPRNQRTRIWNAALSGEFGPIWANIAFTDWRYWDRREVQPDTSVRRWLAEVSLPVSGQIGVGGMISRTDIELSGGPKNRVELWGVSGDWQMTEATSANFQFRNETLDLPAVQNAYVRERFLTRAQVTHRFPNWTAQVGFKRLEVERVRADRTFADVPRWDTWEARLVGKLAPGLRLTLRGWEEELSGTVPMSTDDPRGLFWSQRRFGELKLDHTSTTHAAYAVASYRYLGNEARGVRIRTNYLMGGFSWQLSPLAELFAEAAWDRIEARSDVAEPPSLDGFFPGSVTSTVGLNWQVDPATHLSASLTLIESDGRNPLALAGGSYLGQFLTATVSRQLANGANLHVTFAPWYYTDRAFKQMGFKATVFGISMSGRF